MSYFVFKGINSKEHVTLERIPLTTRPERVTQIIDIPGGEPVIYQSDGYRTVPVTLQLGIKDTSAEHMDYLNNWLSGAGEIIFSNDLERYQTAVCNGNLTGNRLARTLGKMPVSFTLLPFKYSISNEWEEISLSPTPENDGKQAWIPYSGTMFGKPIIKLYGTGELDLQFGVVGIKIRNVRDYCIIDVPQRRVYDKNGNVILNETIGNVTDLQLTDMKYIRVSNAVTKFEIKKNTRWLS